MNLFKDLEKKYTKNTMRAGDAQHLANEIAFAPVVFQISRLMLKYDIFNYLYQSDDTGLTMESIVEKTGLSTYAVKVLLEASLSIRTVTIDSEDNYHLSKVGWFLLNDEIVKANLNFNHDVNYKGLFYLDEALETGKPSGLKVFGEWDTLYEGLSSLPKQVQDSWFGFDHFYSDNSFQEALEIIFQSQPKRLLDVGGNTGRMATQCVNYDANVEVTIMDLPQQIALMQKAVAEEPNKNRINGHGANLLDLTVKVPTGFDVIWMSQFLDCFSEPEILHILQRTVASMNEATELYIMETFWDRQKYETAAYCLTLTSVYFTAMANGNSKMYHSDDFIKIIELAGLKIEKIHDEIGMGHTILKCTKA
ncbi:class I SAM-dependent methyltransferase [Gammaproteobacteria bacterium]|nr:class I SAM-dependent methyltransferase [Gammaproteobacteria bacterium]